MVSVVKDGVSFNVSDENIQRYISSGYTVEKTEEPQPVAVENVPEVIEDIPEIKKEPKKERKPRANKNK